MNQQRPIRCLIIQMARMGDTLQSLMALRAAKQLYPQLEIHFVARESFADAVKRVPWLKSVISFPSEQILGPVLSGSGSNKQALAEVAKWVRPLVAEPWDLVLNWSYSESSSYLMGLIPSRVKLGFSRAEDVSLSCPDGWSHYIQAVVQGGIQQNIHLTDVLTTQLLTALQIHVGDPADNGDAPVTSKSFFALNPSSADSDLSPRWRDRSKKWVAMQLNATEPAWAAEHWATLIAKILSQNPEYGILLLGGKEEQELSSRVLLNVQRRGQPTVAVLSLVGRADFDLWASAVSRAQWLFSCDTAAVPLASVLGTRVVNLNFGHKNGHKNEKSRWSETGPYGNGHYIISSDSACPPELVHAAWSYAIQDSTVRQKADFEQYLGRLNLAQHLKEVRVLRSRIRNSMDGGGVVYESLSCQPLTLEEWTSLVMGHIARAWYCGWVPPVGHELPRTVISPQLIQALRSLQESAEVLTKVCEEATRTAAQLARHSSKLKSQKIMRVGDREQLADLSHKLQELDALIARLGQTHTSLLAFSQMSKVLMHNLRSTNLAELGKESAECYRQLHEGVGILRDWAKHTLTLARPVALRSVPLALVESRV